jgi:hypothetical protein
MRIKTKNLQVGKAWDEDAELTLLRLQKRRERLEDDRAEAQRALEATVTSRSIEGGIDQPYWRKRVEDLDCQIELVERELNARWRPSTASPSESN